MTGYGNHTPVFRRWMMDDFLQKMHSIAFRVTKSECLDLPEIVEEIRTVNLEPSALRKKQNLAKLLVDDYRKGKNPFKS